MRPVVETHVSKIIGNDADIAIAVMSLRQRYKAHLT